MLQQIAIGLCLVLVIEGLIPALDPARFRRMLELLGDVDDSVIRRIGVGSMAVGAVLLLFIT